MATPSTTAAVVRNDPIANSTEPPTGAGSPPVAETTIVNTASSLNRLGAAAIVTMGVAARTVSVAGRVTTVAPSPSVKTARYNRPESASVGVNESRGSVAPGTSPQVRPASALVCHCVAIESAPAAVAVNATGANGWPA